VARESLDIRQSPFCDSAGIYTSPFSHSPPNSGKDPAIGSNSLTWNIVALEIRNYGRRNEILMSIGETKINPIKNKPLANLVAEKIPMFVLD